MGRPKLNDDEKAVKLTVALPVGTYAKLMRMVAAMRSKASRVVAKLVNEAGEAGEAGGDGGGGESAQK
jgi:hypothetical protein